MNTITPKKKTTKRIPLLHTAVTQVLPYLKTHKQRYGYMPSHREVALHFKKKSANWANLVFKKLAKAKYIKIVTGQHRGITIINKK